MEGEGSGRLEPSVVTALTGAEGFGFEGLTVRDFWSFAFSDLRENVVRGILAEFLVARAVGAEAPVRSAWDNFDVLAPDGTRIEVKSSAYLQSWSQARHSDIRFTGLSALTWDAEKGYGDEREVRADVFVFCVHTCRDPVAYDPIELGQWEFYALPAEVVRTHGTRSVGLGFLTQAGAQAVALTEVGAAVAHAARNGR